MYSEHAIARVLPYVATTFSRGGDLDQVLTRTVVEIGRILGPDLGCPPADASVAWWARKAGTPAAAGTRGAVHLLPDGRVGLGLGAGRGVVETAGDRLAIVERPEPGRYAGAYYMPTITYGGLL